MKKILLCLFLLSNAIFANIEDFKVGTWNLQGASAGTESKWNVSVRQLISGENAVDILLVQEAGSLPQSATPTGRVIQPGGTPIAEYTWNLGSISRPNNVFIYYSNIDVGARRVNLAIVSRQQAEEVFVINQSVVTTGFTRPAIGIRIGNSAFFNVHALARGGNDAPALVTAVHDHFNGRPDITWLIGGDFNRNPAELQAGLDTRITNNIRILDPRIPTHSGGRTLDYALIGNTPTQGGALGPLPALVALLMNAALKSYLASDHFPVRFGKF